MQTGSIEMRPELFFQAQQTEVDESWRSLSGLSSDEEGLEEGRGAAAAAAIGATAAAPAMACHS